MIRTALRCRVALLSVLLAVILAVPPGAAAGTAASGDVKLSPTDVEIGDDAQSVRLAASGIESGGTADLYVNVTSLEAAGVDLDGLAVEAELSDAEVRNRRVVREDGTTVVHLRVDLDEGETGFDGALELVGLDTDDAEPTEGLTYHVALVEGEGDERVGANAPDASDGESQPFDLRRPDATATPGEGEPVVELAPHDVDLGADEQLATLRALGVEPGATVHVYANVTSLEAAGVALDGLEVTVDADGVVGAEPAGTAVTREDDTTVVRLTFEVASDETEFAARGISLSGLDTGDAEPTEGLAYHVALVEGEGDERVGADAPDGDDRQSGTFALRDPDASTPMPDGADTDTPMATAEGDDGGEGGGVDQPAGESPAEPTTEPTDTALDGPGFTAVAALAAMVALVAGLVRASRQG